ncbi:MAG: SDR family NAD(P)-dependent oxidoreductase [Armatimonadota bacterium]
MDKVALVTGADRGLGLALVNSLLDQGWIVFAGKHLEWPELDELKESYPTNLNVIPLDVSSDESVIESAKLVQSSVSHIDLLIANAAINRSHEVHSIRQNPCMEQMALEFNVNAIGALRLVNSFLPLLDAGQMKRLCFVSSEAGSIGASKRTGWFGYCMSKAALNMAVKNLSNDLSSQGFSFRLYHPGWLKTYMSGTKNEHASMEPEEGAEIALEYFLSDSGEVALSLHDWEGNDMPW